MAFQIANYVKKLPKTTVARPANQAIISTAPNVSNALQSVKHANIQQMAVYHAQKAHTLIKIPANAI